MMNKVKKYRQWHGFTQERLATEMKVSRQTIHAIETGKYAPSTVLALKISALLHTPLTDLFELEEEDWQ